VFNGLAIPMLNVFCNLYVKVVLLFCKMLLL